MAARVIVKIVGGPIAGEVLMSPDGGIEVRAADPTVLVPLRALVGRLLAAGVVRRVPDGVLSRETEATRLITERPGSEGFLPALADAITRSGVEIGGLPLRAWVADSREGD
jgi:hypothetical protein